MWHDHADADELFLVLKGRLRIELEDSEIEMRAGSFAVVPRGVRHNPVADEPCFLALIEPASTRHTGDVVTPRARSLADQMGSKSDA